MKIEQDKLDQLQKMARIMAILSFAVFVGLLAFGIWQLRETYRKINEADRELDWRRSDILAKEQKIAELDARIREKEQMIEAQGQIIGDTPNAGSIIARVLENDPHAASLLPRVYIHIGQESQRPGARKLARKLRKAGYLIPGIQLVGKTGPKESDLRYCEGKGEESDIAAIRNFLAGENIAIASIRILKTADVPACAQVSSTRSYELWLGEDFKPKTTDKSD